MKKDPMSNADKILSSIDSNKLKNGIEKLKGLSEAENAKLKKQLENIDKQKVLDMLSQLSPDVIKQKMSGIDFDRLGDIVEKSGSLDKIKKDKKQR